MNIGEGVSGGAMSGEGLEDAAASHPPPPIAARRALGFGLWGGAVAWTAHLLLAYLIAEWGCLAGWGARMVGGMSLVGWMLAVMSAVMWITAMVATLVAFRYQRRLARARADEPRTTSVGTPSRAQGARPMVHDADLFLARAGSIISVIFLLVIVVQTVPILFYYRGC